MTYNTNTNHGLSQIVGVKHPDGKIKDGRSSAGDVDGVTIGDNA